MKLTDFFGKQVFSIYEGEIVATISGVSFCYLNNKLKSFYAFDNEENEYKILINDIKAMNDVVVITNTNKLKVLFAEEKNEIMFKYVIDQNGNNLGKIIDAEIDESGKIQHFITSKNKEVLTENIYIRKDFIYYSENKIKISAYKPKQNIADNLSNIKVNILNEGQKNKNFLPIKTKFNPSFILGQISKKDLYGLNNELIVKANQIITEKIISDASKHNKLNELYFITN